MMQLSEGVRTCYRVKREPELVQDNGLCGLCALCGKYLLCHSCAAKRRARASHAKHLMFLTAHWALMGLASITTVGEDPVLDIDTGGRCWFSFPSSSRNLCVALAPLRDSPSSYASPRPSIAPAPSPSADSSFFCSEFIVVPQQSDLSAASIAGRALVRSSPARVSFSLLFT